MDYHQNARLTIHSREQLARAVVEKGWTLKLAAASFNVSAKTAAKWVGRYREQGAAGLRDRSSRPWHVRQPTSAELVERVEVLRRERWTGFRIARQTGLSRATVSRILRRLKLSRVRDLGAQAGVPALRARRSRRPAAPGHQEAGPHRQTLAPSDRKPPGLGLGRGVGSTCMWPSTITRASPSRRFIPTRRRSPPSPSCTRALAYYARLGIQFRAVLTDNGPAYRSHAFAVACRTLGLKHRFTRPYTPRTNGKAERFIQTALREWAYLRSYQDSNERSQELHSWLHQYNWHRPHSSLGLSPPISRSGLDRNNLLRLHN